MKKLVALLLTATVAMSLVACGGAKTEETAPVATEEVEAVEETVEAEETETVEETAEAEEAVTEEVSSTVPAFTCDWDKVVCTFGEDGSFKMELPEYQITEEGTWTANEDGTYTITSPAGKAHTSYTGEDGLVHLDYVADASEQLVAQLYIK